MEATVAHKHDADRARGNAFVVSPGPLAPAISAAVERAYTSHYRDVYRYVLALTRSAADAEEVAAEVFERALRSWDEVPERVLPWLLLTARRMTTDRWRRASRFLAIQSRLRVAHPASAGEERTEFWTWFDAVSSVLTDRQREVLVLRYQRDLTDTDIGVILGLSASGVRSLVARALDALRSHPEML
jgi:RNA polymerase sigma-70 factor (ECF subfamily)